jgi:hypothetical protein
MTIEPAPLGAGAVPSEPTQSCVRCGATVPYGTAMCENCNPLGLKPPAATQAHGTIFLAIVISVALLAVAGRFAVAGVGPFDATVERVAANGNGLSVTITVTNRGRTAGATTCRLFDPNQTVSASAYLLSPQVAPGATISFSRQTTELGSEVRPLETQCSAP